MEVCSFKFQKCSHYHKNLYPVTILGSNSLLATCTHGSSLYWWVGWEFTNPLIYWPFSQRNDRTSMSEIKVRIWHILPPLKKKYVGHNSCNTTECLSWSFESDFANEIICYAWCSCVQTCYLPYKFVSIISVVPTELSQRYVNIIYLRYA